MFEIHVNVPAMRSLLLDRSRPRFDVTGRVTLVAQPEIPMVRGDRHGRRHLLAVGDAERQVARSQPLEHLIAQPRGMPKLERRAGVRRESLEKRIEYCHVLPEEGREL